MQEGAAGLEPTEQELKISARLLLHIARQPRFGPGETAAQALTQAGLAATLGTTQSAVSNCLTRLVRGRALSVETVRVVGRRQRVKVYQLTDEGEALVQHVRESMAH